MPAPQSFKNHGRLDPPMHFFVMPVLFINFCVTIYIAINENESWYLDDNIKAHIADPSKLNRYEFHPITATGIFGTVAGTGFADTNVKWSINGYIYGNTPMMTMKIGDHVRWYVATLGDFNNAHTPHWHGNTVLVAGQRTDVISVAAAQMITADMQPEDRKSVV